MDSAKPTIPGIDWLNPNDPKTPFIKAIEDEPKDDAPKLVYADWLDEHGDYLTAARLRWYVHAIRNVFTPEAMHDAGSRFGTGNPFRDLGTAAYYHGFRHGHDTLHVINSAISNVLQQAHPINWSQYRHPDYRNPIRDKQTLDGALLGNELMSLGVLPTSFYTQIERHANDIADSARTASLMSHRPTTVLPSISESIHSAATGAASHAINIGQLQNVQNPLTGSFERHEYPIRSFIRMGGHVRAGNSFRGTPQSETLLGQQHASQIANGIIKHPHWDTFPTEQNTQMSLRSRAKQAIQLIKQRQQQPIRLTGTMPGAPEPSEETVARTSAEPAIEEPVEEEEEVDEDQQPYTCPECSDEHDTREEGRLVQDDGTQACTSCAASCPTCDNIVSTDDLVEVPLTHREREAARRRNPSLGYGALRRLTNSVCEDCRDNNYTRCADCDEYYNSDDGGGNNSNDDPVCEGCSENYFYCDSCNNTFSNDDYGEEGNCQDCSKSDQIHESQYKPPSWKKHGGTGRKFGVELETAVERGGDESEAADETLSILNKGLPEESFAFLKEDSSIKGPSGGFEIVTHPATLPIHRERWNPFFDDPPSYLKSNYKKYDTGLHVHVSREGLSLYETLKMVTFVNSATNEEFIKEIAMRDPRQWARLDPHKKVADIKRPNTRYEAINLSNNKTIEFRIFAGTMNKRKFFRSLEFVDAVAEFAKSPGSGLQNIQGTDAFFKFVIEHRKDYPILSRYVSNYIGPAEQEAREESMMSAQLSRFNNNPNPIPVRARPRTKMSVTFSVHPKISPRLSSLIQRVKQRQQQNPPMQFNMFSAPLLPDNEYKNTHDAVHSLFGHDPDGVPAWASIYDTISPGTTHESAAKHASLITANWLSGKKSKDPETIKRIIPEHLIPHRDKIIRSLQRMDTPTRTDELSQHAETPIGLSLARSSFQPDMEDFKNRSDVLRQVFGKSPVKSELVKAVGDTTQAASKLSSINHALQSDVDSSLTFKKSINHAAKSLGWDRNQVQESVWQHVVGLLAAQHGVPPEKVAKLISQDEIAKGYQEHAGKLFPVVANASAKFDSYADSTRKSQQRAEARATQNHRPGIIPIRNNADNSMPLTVRHVEDGNRAKDRILGVLRKVMEDHGLMKDGQIKMTLYRAKQKMRLAAYDAPLDFAPAAQRAEAANQQPFVDQLHQALLGAGIVPQQVTTAIHDHAGQARTSVIAVGSYRTPQAPELAAAWMGLLGRQPGMVAFTAHPEGKDAMYRFSHPDANAVKSALDAAGVRSRTLVPNKNNYDVYVYDKGEKLTNNVAHALIKLGVTSDAWLGNGEDVGGKQEDMGRGQYRDAIGRNEKQQLARQLVNKIRMCRAQHAVN